MLVPRNHNNLTIASSGKWNGRVLLTVAEVAERARVHPKTGYRWIKDGKLESIQFGPCTFRIPEIAVRKLQLRGARYSGISQTKHDGSE